MPPWSMISPASRGIGFGLARRVLQTTNAPVVATVRKDLDKTKEQLLEGLEVDEARLRVLKLDVTGWFFCSNADAVMRASSCVADILDEADDLCR